MPRKEIDYSKTIIYKIVCNDLSIKSCFVGSTTNFTKCKSQYSCYIPNSTRNGYNSKLYSFIRENGGWINFSMLEIEKFPCNDGNEARARVRHFHEQLNSDLNQKCLTDEELNLNYKKHIKTYYDNNKERICEYKKQKILCSCGKEITRNYKFKHEKTIFHIENNSV